MEIKFNDNVDHNDINNFILMVKKNKDTGEQDVIVKSNKTVGEKISNFIGRFVYCMQGSSYKTSRIWDAIQNGSGFKLSKADKAAIEDWMKDRLQKDRKSDYVRFVHDTEVSDKLYGKIEGVGKTLGRRIYGKDQQDENKAANRIADLAKNLFPYITPESRSNVVEDADINAAEISLTSANSILHTILKDFDYDPKSELLLGFKGILIIKKDIQQDMDRAFQVVSSLGLSFDTKRGKDDAVEVFCGTSDRAAIKQLADRYRAQLVSPKPAEKPKKTGVEEAPAKRTSDQAEQSTGSTSANRVVTGGQSMEVSASGPTIQDLEKAAMVPPLTSELAEGVRKQAIANFLNDKMSPFYKWAVDGDSLVFSGLINPGSGSDSERVLKEINSKIGEPVYGTFESQIGVDREGSVVKGRIDDLTMFAHFEKLAINDLVGTNVVNEPIFTDPCMISCRLDNGEELTFAADQTTTVGELRYAILGKQRKEGVQKFNVLLDLGGIPIDNKYDLVPLSRLHTEGGASVLQGLNAEVI